MKIAIIGTGNIGSTLGPLWSKRGHDVFYGMRDTSKTPPEPDAKRGNPLQAATFGEVVVLATPWLATPATIARLGSLSGKIVIDCTNPMTPDLAGLSVGLTDSAGETVARLAKDARVVKCFNTLGAHQLATPRFGDQTASMFLCGDDPQAKEVVTKLGRELGLDMIDVGGIKQSRLLEPMALMWVTLALEAGFGTNIAFKLLQR